MRGGRGKKIYITIIAVRIIKPTIINKIIIIIIIIYHQ